MTAPAARRGGPVVPAPAIFVAGALSQYLGAALAVTLFDDVPAVGVAWWRVVGAALVLMAWRRPWRRRWTTTDVRWVAAFGVVLAAMNLSFYASIDRLPLGTAVAIEFLGPITVAAAGTRTRRDLGALTLAVAGVVLLADVSWDDDGAGRAGVAFALLAAALWAGYIVLGRRVAAPGRADGRSGPAGPSGAARPIRQAGQAGRPDGPGGRAGRAGPDGPGGRAGRAGHSGQSGRAGPDGLDGLALATAIGAVVWAPLGLARGWPALDPPVLVGLCLVVGVLSNAVPYGLDQVVLPRLTAAHFALLLALLPATAAVVGLVALGQVPTAAEVVGIGLVVAAVVARTPERPVPADAIA